MKLYNLVLSGGGVRSYAHIGVYKFLYEEGIEFDEIIGVSGGAIIAPFIFLRKKPNDIINLFLKEKIHHLLFPFWFIPNKFELLIAERSTQKLGDWIENKFTNEELGFIKNSNRLHIMGTCYPTKGCGTSGIDMLNITSLKNAVAASCAISGIFKAIRIGDFSYIDGGHWNNAPIFYDFKNSCSPLLVSALGYTGLCLHEGGRISKLIRSFEIASYARLKEDVEQWEFEKNCKQRGDLILIKPPVWDINSLDFNISESQIETLIENGYNACKKAFAKEMVA